MSLGGLSHPCPGPTPRSKWSSCIYLFVATRGQHVKAQQGHSGKNVRIRQWNGESGPVTGSGSDGGSMDWGGRGIARSVQRRWRPTYSRRAALMRVW